MAADLVPDLSRCFHCSVDLNTFPGFDHIGHYTGMIVLPGLRDIGEYALSKCSRRRFRSLYCQNHRISAPQHSTRFHDTVVIQRLKLVFGVLRRLPGNVILLTVLSRSTADLYIVRLVRAFAADSDSTTASS